MKAGCMIRTRAYRRAQWERKKQKYRKILLREYIRYNLSEKDIEKRVAKMANTPHPMKCQCCCNPRHSSWYNNENKLTIQERRISQVNLDWELSYGDTILGT